MKIIIAGLPKSGTTILTYRVSGSLKGSNVVFEPHGPRDTSVDDRKKDLVVKRLFPGQGTKLQEYKDFDKKIWIVRDPRDFLISQCLYSWYRNGKTTDEDKDLFKKFINTLKAKEINPADHPFISLDPKHYIRPFKEVVANYERLVNDGWFILNYEDMVDGKYDDLNEYLGFEVAVEATVHKHFKRVVRSKNYGAWRDWFTKEDVEFYREMLESFLDTFGYDTQDWELNPSQQIDPAIASEYASKLFNGKL